MARLIKRSAIPFSGYVYQNFIGLQILLEWLENPSLYEWVQFEADGELDAKGPDDIIAKRADTGQFVLLQVKFTVDPNDSQKPSERQCCIKQRGMKPTTPWQRCADGANN